MNVEYRHTNGFRPSTTIPAAKVTACCSAMPTSNVRLGNLRPNLSSPVPPDTMCERRGHDESDKGEEREGRNDEKSQVTTSIICVTGHGCCDCTDRAISFRHRDEGVGEDGGECRRDGGGHFLFAGRHVELGHAVVPVGCGLGGRVSCGF